MAPLLERENVLRSGKDQSTQGNFVWGVGPEALYKKPQPNMKRNQAA